MKQKERLGCGKHQFPNRDRRKASPLASPQQPHIFLRGLTPPKSCRPLLSHADHNANRFYGHRRKTKPREFFRKSLARPSTVNPRTTTVDRNAAYPKAVADMKQRLWRFSKLRQVKYLNNIVEQDHRRIKRLVRPGLGFKRFRTAWRTVVGYEALAMMRKGQVKGIGGDDIVAQAAFVNSLFDIAA
jgi:hypothetical protein